MPCSSSASQRWEPRKPAPPVTRDVAIAGDRSGRGGRGSRACTNSSPRGAAPSWHPDVSRRAGPGIRRPARTRSPPPPTPAPSAEAVRDDPLPALVCLHGPPAPRGGGCRVPRLERSGAVVPLDAPRRLRPHELAPWVATRLEELDPPRRPRRPLARRARRRARRGGAPRARPPARAHRAARRPTPPGGRLRVAARADGRCVAPAPPGPDHPVTPSAPGRGTSCAAVSTSPVPTSPESSRP